MPPTQLPSTDAGTGAPAVTPRASLLEHLLASGGQLAERQLVSEVGYGTAACRRVLAELETAGRVGRRDVGDETIVYASEASPTTSG